MIFPGITAWSENFLTPSLRPAEPPWFFTVPPARLVAVRIEPRTEQGLTNREYKGYSVCYLKRATEKSEPNARTETLCVNA
jgi:hypothetical protein